jgi:rod shape determining protein RodA
MDWLTIALSLALVAIGLMAISSSEAANQRYTDHVFHQLCALGVGGVVAFGLMIVPYQIFRSYFWGLYALSLGILALVLMTGAVFRGTQGWFEIGSFRVQASEVARPLFVVAFAALLDDQKIRWEDMRSLIKPLAVAAGPVLLLLMQPDLSGALVYIPVTAGMLYLAGARPLHLLSLAVVAGLTFGMPLAATSLEMATQDVDPTRWQRMLISILSGGWPGLIALAVITAFIIGVWWFLKELRISLPSFFLLGALALVYAGAAGGSFLQHHIKHYQKERLVTFVNPSADPLGSGYQVRQSKIAIGSGRFLGKGLSNTTQIRLGFLPTYHTDFIFSVVGEEFGFFGCLGVMAVYLLLVWRCFDVAAGARERFGSLLAAGIGIVFTFHGFFNLGMTLGLTPVIGVPLPLVSYGGSALVSYLMTIGLTLSIYRYRYIL